MASSLFKNQTIRNNNLGDIMKLANDIKRNGPEAIFNQMYNSNPQFRKFINENKGKTPEQIARENNIPL